MAMEVVDRNCIGAIEENFAFGLSGEAGAILIVADDDTLAAGTRKGAAAETDCTLWRVAPACAGRRSLPCGLSTAASRAILLSDAKRIGWTAFLTPTSK